MQTRLPRVVLGLLIAGLLVFFINKKLNTPNTPIVQVRTAGAEPEEKQLLSGEIVVEEAIIPEAPKSPVANSIASEGKEFVPVEGAQSYSLSEGQVINWVGKKVGSSHQGILKPRQGILQIKDGNLVAGGIVFDMKTIQTTDEAGSALDTELHGASFFDTKTFETASFIVQEAINGTLVGVLTMKGVANQINIPATIIIEDNQVIVRSEFALDKAKRGINGGGAVVSKYIELSFTLRFVR